MNYRRHSIQSKNIDGSGTHELVFYDFGDVDALQVTVCAHGLTRNAHDFDLLATELASRKRRVFTLNMAGRGESEWLKNPDLYNYATYVTDCIAILDNFHLRKVEWVGTSMGGIIGMMIAASQEDRIRRMVLNDVGTFLSKDALARIYGYVRQLPASFASREEAEIYLERIFEPFGITDPMLWQQFVDHSLITKNNALHYACDPAIIEPVRRDTKEFTEIADVNLAEMWEKIYIPTLILRGALSDVLDEPTVSAMRSTNTKAEAVSIPHVGHAPALMDRGQIALVADWLDRSRKLVGI